MFSQVIHKQIHFTLCCLLAFTLVFKFAAPVLASLLFLNWLLEGRFAGKFRSIPHLGVFWLFIAFYVLHLISLLWTADLEAGLFKLEIKLPLFVFPLIFATRPFTHAERDRVLQFYVFGCAALCVTLLGRALILFISTGQNHFYYTGLSWFLHTSYVAMYLNLAIGSILLSVSRKSKVQNKLDWFFLVLLLLTVVLLSSKMGHLVLLLMLSVWVAQLIFQQKNYVFGIGVLACMLLAAFGVWRSSSTVTARMANSLQTLAASHTDKATTESTGVRLLMWEAAFNISCKKPLLGTGVGAEQAALMNMYAQEGIQRALNLNLNVHNAYLEMLVSLGYPGSLVLLFVLFIPLVISIKKRNLLHSVFVMVILLNFISESMLEAQAGTMFFGFFCSFLFFSEQGGFELLSKKENL